MRHTFQYALTLAVLVVLGVLADLPKPHMDDLFYIGTAINYATTGVFENPLLERQFGKGTFLVYPPTQSVLLFNWFRLFGHSTLSILALYNFCLALSSLLAARLIFGQRLEFFPVAIAAMTVYVIGLSTGLRAETLTITLLFIGIALFSTNRLVLMPLAGAALVLAGTCAPRFTFYCAVIVSCVMGVTFWKQRDAPARLALSIALLMFGAAAATLYVLSFIDFRLNDLVQAIRFHISRGPPQPYTLPNPGPTYWISAGAMMSMTCAMAIVVMRRGKPLRHYLLTLISGLLVASCVVLIGNGRISPAELLFVVSACVLLISATAAPQLRTWEKAASLATLAAAISVGYLHVVIDTAALALGQSRFCGETCRQAAINSVAQTPPGSLLVEAGAARYIFDYSLPAKAIDLVHAGKFPRSSFHTCREIPVGDVALVARNPFRWGYRDLTPPPSTRFFRNAGWSTWLPVPDETFTVRNCRSDRNVPAKS